MRYLCGRPEAIFDELCKDHRKKSPFYVALSTSERCETFRELARERFGHDVTPGHFVSRHSGRDIEWIVTTPGRAPFIAAKSCAIEDGASNGSADLDGVAIPECLAIVRVYWSPGDAPPKVDETRFWVMRGARLCSCYGALVFMVLFFVAVIWEWLF